MKFKNSKPRKLFKFKNIKAKLLIGFLTIIILTISFGIYNSISLNGINANSESIFEEDVPSLIVTQKLQLNISEQISLARAYTIYGYEAYIEQYDKLVKERGRLEEQLLQYDKSNEIQELIKNSAILEGNIREDVFALYDSDDQANIEANLNAMNALRDQIVRGYSDLVSVREVSVASKGKQLVGLANSSLLVGITITVAVTIFGIIIALVVASTITKPLRRVSQHMNLIANGDLSNESLEVTSDDEIGSLIVSTNKMQTNLSELVLEINSLSQSVAQRSKELTQSTYEVKEGSNQIASTMQELSSGAEAQANRAGELSTAMTIFAEKVSQANENGNEVNTSSEKVAELTNEGKQLMDSSIEQMTAIFKIVEASVNKVKGLDQQSKEISKLVGVIKDIAEQTNLLALNAAIEAARAGEHGKGFAVVADEVRKLAEQVSLSVEDITSIVANIQSESNDVTNSLENGYQEVQNGMNQVKLTGQTFEDIDFSLTEMIKRIRLITNNLTDIDENSMDMNRSIEDIAAVSEESAAGVEQTSASIEQTGTSMEEVALATDELANLTTKLNVSISRFKLK
ncbi:putative sensory transducer protein YvaQ [Paraliobacillus quinghaiensis]|uniref:Sensory transducer protein YvaQ n=1 Tax=Paraliobacillus quinghaiensis TaxID=470815 RepID=A0A917TX81_9BACI|nr:methyl-accepting chemotaxis protein [Paraliobacillus quinghaiensis]GGM42630.1 putative sensory transducer protein YvaQ [Paraliobacillus quinghaiensis]